VVIGGSLAGMLAARVLADHFDGVTLLERDRFPESPAARNGLPHGRHAHGLLERGRRVLERFLVIPVEGGRWLVSLVGGDGQYPPTDEAGFLAFARRLRSPALYTAIEGA
jgi:flavin-dependent dehydrogenase